MEGIRTLFFDTYAFFELIAGNERYKAYSKGIAIITTRFNLMELHYGLLIKHGKEAAEKYYYGLLKFAVEVTDVNITNANDLRASLRKKKLSYVDCIANLRGFEACFAYWLNMIFYAMLLRQPAPKKH